MQITVDVADVSNKMYLKQAQGDGSYGEKKITLTTVIPGGSPLIGIKEGDESNKWYLVDINDIVKGVCATVMEGEDND